MAKKNKVLINFKISEKLKNDFDEKLNGRNRTAVFVKFIEKVVNGEISIDDLFTKNE